MDLDVLELPPWSGRRPSVILRLAELRKSAMHPLTYQKLHADIQHEYADHYSIYTDGSKDKGRVAAAAVCRGLEVVTRIPDQSSIFMTEARALLLALEYIEASDRRDYIIYSDSFSCLQAVANLKIEHPILKKVILKMNALATADHDIHLC
jgi:hypothetical protein